MGKSLDFLCCFSFEESWYKTQIKNLISLLFLFLLQFIICLAEWSFSLGSHKYTEGRLAAPLNPAMPLHWNPML